LRRAGVLLHVSSLPSEGPIGDLGPAAYGFLDFLAASGCKLWQILPLNPTDHGHSPYGSPSGFAGNPDLLSVQALADAGLVQPGPVPVRHGHVDWDAVKLWKRPLLRTAARALVAREPEALDHWRAEQPWADDWGLYAALDEQHGSWWTWPDEALRHRDPEALERARGRHEAAIQEHLALQLLFDRQWAALKWAAGERGIQILGDMPLFVSGGGCDTWAHRALFDLDGEGRPRNVAGAPPDAFSAEGQLWGNPVYAWDAHRADGFTWWRARVARVLQHTDRVRIDHFRGLQATWTIPAHAGSALEGAWREVPGGDLLEVLPRERLFAEDLGTITPEVLALRARSGLPGMKVLQFAFGEGATHAYLPHTYDGPGWVVYTGTHDNDTCRGWYAGAPEHARDRYRRYTARDGSDVAWDLIRLAWASVANDAVAQMQDVLDLGSTARMNTPGTTGSNWSWRVSDVPWWVSGRLAELSEAYGR